MVWEADNMTRSDYRSLCEGPSDNHCTVFNERQKKPKPIEVFVYIDPLCPNCWQLEAVMKKLTVEYGRYLTMRQIIVTERPIQPIQGKKLRGADMRREEPHPFPSYKAAIAIKAAELQGKTYGRRFLQSLRRRLFLEDINVDSPDVLLECARSAKLDIGEFQKDIASHGPIKALQCDRRLMAEMDVHEFPTLVFFNIRDDKEGIKISGNYPYSVYVEILTEALGETPTPEAPPSLLDFMKRFEFVTTEELAIVYNMDEPDVIREMKKLKLKQLVDAVVAKSKTYWHYIGE